MAIRASKRWCKKSLRRNRIVKPQFPDKTKPMPSGSDVKFEIGHVLFIDIVGYSKLLINEQSEQIQTLRKIVRGAEQFRLAEAEGKLVRLPTGDGAALVFRTNVEAPALCALEISKELKNHSDLHVRMGIHSGPVNEVVDLNEQANIAGAGINIAQRVMDCGDSGHILVSKRVADDLEHYSQWRSLLHELGEYEVKHGLRISLLNLYGDEAGNPELPEKFRQVKAKRQTPGAAPAKSVAVLPFVNMSADKHDEYLSDGMTEELINALAKVPGLRVPGRTSCFAFKGKNEDDIFRKVGEQLHVNAVLEGSVRKAGDKLRITAQLINVADGYHLWSEDYDGDVRDIFTFQSNVAQRVVEALQIKLGVEVVRALAKKPTANPEAHRLYLLGRYEFGQYSEAGWTSSIRYYEQALKLDPNYALAYCGLADTYAYMGGVVMPSKEAVAKEKEFAQKAIELDPLNSFFQSALAYFLYHARRYDDAIVQIKKTLELDPASTLGRHLLGCCLLWKGDTAGATAEFQRSKIMVTGAWYQGLLGYAYAISGDRPKAEQMLRDLEEMAKRQYVNSSAFAAIYLGLGEKEKALDWLDVAYENQESACWLLKVDPIYDSVRGEPSFQALVKKVFRDAQ